MMRVWQAACGSWRTLRATMLTTGLWLLWAQAAWAAEGKDASSASDWGLAYVLTFLCVVLGMLAVCRPSRRRERDRPEQYGE